MRKSLEVDPHCQWRSAIVRLPRRRGHRFGPGTLIIGALFLAICEIDKPRFESIDRSPKETIQMTYRG
jgi:hypothetical protein